MYSYSKKPIVFKNTSTIYIHLTNFHPIFIQSLFFWCQEKNHRKNPHWKGLGLELGKALV